MNIEMINTLELVPYENNPRNNEDAVSKVAESIKEFGFKVPIVVDKNNVIVSGHTRHKAAARLGMDKVPCIRADDLSDDQIRAFRLADNKVAEFATWDFEKLHEEIAGIDLDMATFGFKELDEYLEDVENIYTQKVKTPVYEITGEKPAIKDLCDTERADWLRRKILAAKLPKDLETFLIHASHRHLVFDYGKIAEFYAHSDKVVQDLMEDSALVIIDYDKAIELGYVKLQEAVRDLVEYVDE